MHDFIDRRSGIRSAAAVRQARRPEIRWQRHARVGFKIVGFRAEDELRPAAQPSRLRADHHVLAVGQRRGQSKPDTIRTRVADRS